MARQAARTLPSSWTYSQPFAPAGDEVRTTLAGIRARGKEIWETDLRVFVDRAGHAFFETQGVVRRGARGWTSVIPGALNVLAEFLRGRGDSDRTW